MLPGIFPNKVVGRIADLVTGDGSAVIGFQQVAPLGIGIAVVRLDSFVCCSGVIGVDRPCQDIACIVVGPNRDGICFLVLLPDQLIGRIVSIAGGMATVTDAGEVKGTEKLSP